MAEAIYFNNDLLALSVLKREKEQRAIYSDIKRSTVSAFNPIRYHQLPLNMVEKPNRTNNELIKSGTFTLVSCGQYSIAARFIL